MVLGGGLKHLFMFTPIPGEMIQFDLRIFFRWVGEKPPDDQLLFFFKMTGWWFEILFNLHPYLG